MGIRPIFRLLCFIPGFALIPLTSNAETPRQVTLDYQFRKQTPIQEGGSCHIFAATALVEAACFRALGRTVDISEGRLFDRHLLKAINDPSKYSTFLRGKGESVKLEGGRPLDTVNRILENNVCAEVDSPLDRSFIQDFEKIAQAVKTTYATSVEYSLGQFKTPPSSPENRELLIKIMDRDFHRSAADENFRLLEHLKSSIVTRVLNREAIRRADQAYKFHRERANTLSSELIYASSNAEERGKSLLFDTVFNHLKSQKAGNRPSTPEADAQRLDLRECLMHKLVVRTMTKPSIEQMTELLSRKLPFICETTLYHPDGTSGQHATTVIGYRTQGAAKGGLDFRLRDSNLAAPFWVPELPLLGPQLSCKQIVYIEP